MRLLINFLLYQVAWLAAVLGAAAQHPGLGPPVALAVFVAHLAIGTNRRVDWWFVPAAAALGYLTDMIQTAAGVVGYRPASPVPPLWMFGLWLSFATMLNAALRVLQDYLPLAALLGLVAGPAAYLSADGLGAVRLHDDRLLAMAAVALQWGLVLPALLWAAARTALWTGVPTTAARTRSS